MIIILFVQLLMINLLLGNWVYDDVPDEMYSELRGENWWKQDDWIQFRLWLDIETYIFYGSLLSGVVYMFFRAFIAEQHRITFV